MYDRRLDGIVASAEFGSFTKAAAHLNISTPALVKQVTSFEREHEITLFERSHAGVTPTAAGSLIVKEARLIMQRSDEALRHARALERDGQTVRMGISIMSPGRQTLDRWSRISAADDRLRLELVPIGSLYAPGSTTMLNLGRDIDVVQTSFSTVRWEGACQLLYLFDAPFYINVPRTNPLAARDRVGIEDLAGLTIRILRNANDQMDRLADVLEDDPEVRVEIVETVDVPLFNDAMAHGDAVLTSGAWSGIHPGFTGVPLAWHEAVPTYLAYPNDPKPHVARFVRELAEES